METERLEFAKIEKEEGEELYLINCEQALEVGFLEVEGSDPFVSHEDAPCAVSRSESNKFGGPKADDDTFKLAYSF